MPSVKLETVSDVIGSLYEAAYDPFAWQSAIERFRKLFHGSIACLTNIETDPQSLFVISTQSDPLFNRLFVEQFSDNVLSNAYMSIPAGVISSIHRLIAPEILRRDALWHEWMAPQDMYSGLGLKLRQLPAATLFIDVQRGRGQEAFDAADAKLFSLLAPHVRRAADMSQRLQLASGLLSAFSYLSVGVAFVDANLRIVRMNASAEALVARRGSPLHVNSGVLETAGASTTAALRSLVIDACGGAHPGAKLGLGGDLLLRDPSHQLAGNLSLSVGPVVDPDMVGMFERCAAIFMQEVALNLPDGFEDRLRDLFDLSPSEARLAAALSAGQSLKAAAVEHGIQISTARSYLESVFRKTRTHQQSQLVALLKSAQPLIRRR